MKFFDAFSGYGGFHLGIERAYDNLRNKSGREQSVSERQHDKGTELHTKSLDSPICIGYSEIDKYASAVYKYHFGGRDEVSSIKDKEQQSKGAGSEKRQCSELDNKCSDGFPRNFGDITTIDPTTIPDFDLFCGGFPCQAFSIAGKRKGFDDTRGTLFFDIARILKEKRPQYLLLENVKGLLSHDSGRTFETILGTLSDLGYSVEWQVLNAKNFGVPQNRERVFIIGHLGGFGGRQVFPIRDSNAKGLKGLTKNASQGYRTYDPSGIATTLASQAGGVGAKTGLYEVSNASNREFGFKEVYPTLQARDYKEPKIVRAVLTPDRLEKRQNGRRFKTDGEPIFTLNTQDKHGVYDGYKIRRLTPTECERLMGLPDGWTKYGVGKVGDRTVIGHHYKDEIVNDDGEVRKVKVEEFGKSEDGIVKISDTQRYKLCGNGVVVNVVEEIIKRLFRIKK